MGEFLAQVAVTWPQSAPIRQVRRAFTGWDQMNGRLLEALAEDVRRPGGE